MKKSELQALKELLKSRKEMLKKQTDIGKREALKNWIKTTKAEIKQHEFARHRG
jgi:hypothetical protein